MTLRTEYAPMCSCRKVGLQYRLIIDALSWPQGFLNGKPGELSTNVLYNLINDHCIYYSSTNACVHFLSYRIVVSITEQLLNLIS